MEIIFDEKGYCKEIELNEIKSRKYKNNCDFLDEKEEESDQVILNTKARFCGI